MYNEVQCKVKCTPERKLVFTKLKRAVKNHIKLFSFDPIMKLNLAEIMGRYYLLFKWYWNKRHCWNSFWKLNTKAEQIWPTNE
jgi:hypothetical protein